MKGTLLKKWVEVHTLNSDMETTKVLSSDLKPLNGSYCEAFQKKIDSIKKPIHYAICFISYSLHTTGKYLSVREIRYRHNDIDSVDKLFDKYFFN